MGTLEAFSTRERGTRDASSSVFYWVLREFTVTLRAT